MKTEQKANNAGVLFSPVNEIFEEWGILKWFLFRAIIIAAIAAYFPI